MSAYLTPGTYLRPKPAEKKDVRLVRTDVAGFVGFAERGPLPLPELQPRGRNFRVDELAIRLTSWNEFTSVFGGFIPYGYLAYAVRAFFENGGTTCHVVRVAATNHPDPLSRPRVASMVIPDRANPVRVGSLSSGVGKGQTDLTLTYTGDERLDNGDLIAIEDQGFTEFVMVIAKATNTVTLGAKTTAPLAAGSGVYRYNPAVVVRATSAGNWGNRIKLELKPLDDSTANEFSLRVTVDAGPDSSLPKQEQFFKRLSLKKTLPQRGGGRNPLYALDVINSELNFITVSAPRSDFDFDKDLSNGFSGGPFTAGPVYLQGGRDGVEKVELLDFTGATDDLRGLRLLEDIDEVGILAAPDAVFTTVPRRPTPVPPQRACEPPPKPPAPDPIAEDPTAIPRGFDRTGVFRLYQTMIDQCERLRDRVAILDSPQNIHNPSTIVDWRYEFHTRFAALYYPWLKVPDPLDLDKLIRPVPPSGHVAGVYAQIDNRFGVQRPPANVALEFITDVVDEVTALQQEELNPNDVNAIRAFRGRGIRVWGARSLAASGDNDWRFIHARRLMSMIEESVYKSMQWTVFESNDFSLRRTLVHSLTVFLEAIWRQGGLKGALPAQGFYVKCDETNNPPAVVDAGQVVCEVGIAVAAPMEFIVFEIRQAPGGTVITELGA
jgi:Bacteriophage tail sheath protein